MQHFLLKKSFFRDFRFLRLLSDIFHRFRQLIEREDTGSARASSVPPFDCHCGSVVESVPKSDDEKFRQEESAI